MSEPPPALETESGDGLLAELADEFLRRCRAGEYPSVDEYASKHPELADRIRELFPAVIVIEQSASRANLDAGPPMERAGSLVGRYKLLERIGEGGFGVVYMAEQQQPVRRKVALKVVKPGMDSRQVLARFEAERQALAIMEHPNIAKVFDGGMTDTGRPYFVMELVKGEPITEYCDRNRLSPRERLELVVQVCNAVQHAHQKGIIHRDIKPTNVLVMMHDTTPMVKVIDFGVAKALGSELTDKTLFTAFAQLVGTPLYMSPEQAGQSSLDVDTRSDIYSLGVLLYELLTGTTPFNKERFKKAAHDEIRRIIREEEPPKPSTRLSESKESLASISAQRHTEPAKLTRLVRGELDWIVLKCLEKDRNRRYETASSLATDIKRHLADEPIQACPPSIAHRLKRFLRRNKTITALVFLVAASVAALAVRYFQSIRNERMAAVYALAETCAATRRYADAEEHYREFLAVAADDERAVDARRGLAVSLLRQGKVQEGTDILQELFLVKLRRVQTPEAGELLGAWRGLTELKTLEKTGPLQDGLVFNGVTDYVVMPTLQFDGRPPWTLEAIVNPISLGRDRTSLVSTAEAGSISIHTLGERWATHLYSADDFRDASHWTTRYASAPADAGVTLKKWQHVAGVWDGKELRTYIDGRLQESRKSADYCTRLSSLPFFLGADPGDFSKDHVAAGLLCGTIRGARISRGIEYTESFASPEQLEMSPETIALYDFTSDNGRYAIDRSGHNHHGIIIGAKFMPQEKSRLGGTTSDLGN